MKQRSGRPYACCRRHNQPACPSSRSRRPLAAVAAERRLAQRDHFIDSRRVAAPDLVGEAIACMAGQALAGRRPWTREPVARVAEHVLPKVIMARLVVRRAACGTCQAQPSPLIVVRRRPSISRFEVCLSVGAAMVKDGSCPSQHTFFSEQEVEQQASPQEGKHRPMPLGLGRRGNLPVETGHQTESLSQFGNAAELCRPYL